MMCRGLPFVVAAVASYCLTLTNAFLPAAARSKPSFLANNDNSAIINNKHHRLRPSSKSSSSLTSLFAKYEKVFVAGGSKGVGRIIIDELLALPYDSRPEVVAMVRSKDDAKTLNSRPGVTAMLGDAFNQKDVENAMDGCDAAITTLGGTTGVDTEEGPKRIDYIGNNNVIESAGILGVTRIILVTSIGCGSSREAAPDAVFEALKDALVAKEKAENVLIKYYTNSNWTIIRPGGLKSEPKTDTAVLTEDNTVIGAIHRADVASLVVKALMSDKTERKIFSAIDPKTSSAVRPSEGGKEIEAFAL